MAAPETCIQTPEAANMILIVSSSGMAVPIVSEAKYAWAVVGAAANVNVRSLNTDLVSSLSSTLVSFLVEAAFRYFQSRPLSFQFLVLLVFLNWLFNPSSFPGRYHRTTLGDGQGRSPQEQTP